jgi:hypothetical protein
MGSWTWYIIFHVSSVAKFDCCYGKSFAFVKNFRTNNMAKSSEQCFLCIGPWYYITFVHVHLVVSVHSREGNGYTNSRTMQFLVRQVLWSCSLAE